MLSAVFRATPTERRDQIWPVVGLRDISFPNILHVPHLAKVPPGNSGRGSVLHGLVPEVSRYWVADRSLSLARPASGAAKSGLHGSGGFGLICTALMTCQTGRVYAALGRADHVTSYGPTSPGTTGRTGLRHWCADVEKCSL